jgi:hypothetical protein
MDQELIRKYVKRKKKTVWGTFFLLIILAVETFYLNCVDVYVFPFCELTWVYIALAVIVLNIIVLFN